MSVESELAGLDSESRALLGNIWLSRARSEKQAAGGFMALVHELESIGANEQVQAWAAQAAEDEVRHSEVCRELAERYLDRSIESVPLRPVKLPQLPGADDELEKHLHVVGLSCINENLAVTFADSCLCGVTFPTLRSHLRQHLHDEVRHARIGWAHLASDEVSDRTRRDISEHAAIMLRDGLARWKRRLKLLPVSGFPEHGYPPLAELSAAADEAVRTLIVPGFSRVGVKLG